MAKFPEIVTSGRGQYNEQRTVWYQGRGQVHRQVFDKPWWGTSEGVECGHKHPTPEAAERCGERLAARRAREINRELAASYAGRECRYEAGDTRHFDGDDPLFIKFCSAHGTAAFHPFPCKPTPEEALALDWSCPWEKVRS